MRPAIAFLALTVLAGCAADQSAPAATPNDTSSSTPAGPGAVMNPGPLAGQCGDPTAHVYHPYRLQLLDRCRTVTGTIATVRPEADGDYHVLLKLDPQYAGMLRPANTTGEHGDLVLEPICQHAVTQADALGPCQGGVPLVPVPVVGTHVSATGAYVLDLDHGGWAELHPLFEIHPG